MAKDIDTKLKNINNLFVNTQESILGKEGKYIIPDYQRAYNWQTNIQCDKLWQDIESFVKNKQNSTYFLGSIIINSEDERLYLIDGQQRITTMFLLLKALLLRIDTVLKDISNDDEGKQFKEYLETRRKAIIQCLYMIDEDDVYLITNGQKKYSDLEIKYINQSINEEYKEELSKILHGNSYEEIEKNVSKIPYKQKNNKYTNFYKNFLYFKEKLDDMGETTLNTFAKEFLASCQVIVVISYQTEESIEIFNSLNSTGMPLADADIISAKLYANFGSKKEEFINDWNDVINRINILSSKKIVTIDDILNEYMYLQRALSGIKDTTLPSVRRYFLEEKKELLNNPQKFVSDLKTIISYWDDDDENENTKNLSETEIKQFKDLYNIREILLKNNSNFKLYYATYFYCNSNKPIGEWLQYVNNLLRLFALLTITDTNYSSSTFKPFLIDLNKKIAGDKITIEEINSLFRDHLNKFDRKEIERTLKKDPCNYGIVFLNEYLYAKEKNVDINLLTDNIQIEHIMPASGKNLAGVREDSGMNEVEFKENVDKIGNKILLEQNINSSISNDWFSVKKQKTVTEKRGYRDSAFPIAKKLIEYPSKTWKKEDIEQATEKASARILKFIFD